MRQGVVNLSSCNEAFQILSLTLNLFNKTFSTCTFSWIICVMYSLLLIYQWKRPNVLKSFFSCDFWLNRTLKDYLHSLIINSSEPLNTSRMNSALKFQVVWKNWLIGCYYLNLFFIEIHWSYCLYFYITGVYPAAVSKDRSPKE